MFEENPYAEVLEAGGVDNVPESTEKPKIPVSGMSPVYRGPILEMIKMGHLPTIKDALRGYSGYEDDAEFKEAAQEAIRATSDKPAVQNTLRSIFKVR